MQAGISDRTPHNGDIVRVDDGIVTAQTAPGATVIFSNPRNWSGEIVTADGNGYAESTLRVDREGSYVVHVSAQTSVFGQSNERACSSTGGRLRS